MASAIDTLHHDSRRDELTGVWNRRHLMEHGPLAVTQPGGALAVVDVDSFKHVNDRLGHATGDAMLRHVAAALREATRATDLVARYGGDEFVVVRPAGGADSLAEDLTPVAVLPDLVTTDDGGTLPLTTSIGIAMGGPGTTWADVFNAADQAMYRSKRLGGGAVHLGTDLTA